MNASPPFLPWDPAHGDLLLDVPMNAPIYNPWTLEQRLHQLCAGQAGLELGRVGRIRAAGNAWDLPRVRLQGPGVGADALHIGVFGGLHGDEPGSVEGVVELICDFLRLPMDFTGYRLSLYPVCNPAGLAAGTRHNADGLDLNRLFWRNTPEAPEVALLEAELRSQRFDGIIALHADDTSAGLYGFTLGQLMNEWLLKPALREACMHLPLNGATEIDGFEARDGIITRCYDGVLAPPPGINPRPFEVIFETPALAPLEQQSQAAACAVRAILREYRQMMAYGQDL